MSPVVNRAKLVGAAVTNPSGSHITRGGRMDNEPPMADIERVVIERRLHIEHGGNDARITNLMKGICEFGGQGGDDQAADDKICGRLSFSRMKSQLEKIKFDGKRDREAINALENSRHSLTDMGRRIQEEIVGTSRLVSYMRTRSSVQMKECEDVRPESCDKEPLCDLNEKIAHQESKLVKNKQYGDDHVVDIATAAGTSRKV